MSDYSELVKALRIVEKEQDCNECEAGRWHHDFNCCLFADAAAAIEALQAENEKLRDTITIQDAALHPNPRYAEPKRGKWVMMRRANSGHYKGCSVCHAPMPTDTMLDYLDDADCKWCYSCGAKMEVQE